VGNKGWSVLFGVVMAACGVSYIACPLMGLGMPEGASSHAHDVDFLYYVILVIVAIFFVLTEAILITFMWQYAGTGTTKHPVSHTTEIAGFLKPLSSFLTNQNRVEMAWTFIPSAILLYIAFAQVNTWATIKYESRNRGMESQEAFHHVAVSARQFEWRMRYPSVSRFEAWMKDKAGTKADADSFGKVPQADDVYTVNELHIWQNHQVHVHLSTRDVIHSFNLPNFRVKQDALPGKQIPVWFRTRDPEDKRNPYKSFNCKWDEKKKRYVDGINPTTGVEDHAFVYDIACAELCGWGHYRMIGRVYVHETQTDFLHWLIRAEEQSRARDTDWWERAEERISALKK
jgi:cytochrome c oxidase subunit 2